VVHTLGNLLTNMSLGAVAVSFTHTIKVGPCRRCCGQARAQQRRAAPSDAAARVRPCQAMEPAFSVTLSALFLGDQPSPAVLLTLLPIMGGVALASMTEVRVSQPAAAPPHCARLTETRWRFSCGLALQHCRAPALVECITSATFAHVCRRASTGTASCPRWAAT
jgi:hypothetical protein